MEAAICGEDEWYGADCGDGSLEISVDEDEVAKKAKQERKEPAEPAELAEMRRIQTHVIGLIANHRQNWENEHPGEIFEAVRPGTRGKSTLTEDERDRLRMEHLEAKAAGKRWQERGPLNSDVSFWRGQARRSGAYGGQKRFSNRGGKSKEYFHQKFMRSEGHIDG